jgi:hypothetical protein
MTSSLRYSRLDERHVNSPADLNIPASECFYLPYEREK